MPSQFRFVTAIYRDRVLLWWFLRARFRVSLLDALRSKGDIPERNRHDKRIASLNLGLS